MRYAHPRLLASCAALLFIAVLQPAAALHGQARSAPAGPPLHLEVDVVLRHMLEWTEMSADFHGRCRASGGTLRYRWQGTLQQQAGDLLSFAGRSDAAGFQGGTLTVHCQLAEGHTATFRSAYSLSDRWDGGDIAVSVDRDTRAVWLSFEGPEMKCSNRHVYPAGVTFEDEGYTPIEVMHDNAMFGGDRPLVLTADEMERGFERTMSVEFPFTIMCGPTTTRMTGSVTLRHRVPPGPRLALDGCTHVAAGASSRITAKASDDGRGEYRFRMDPAAGPAVSGSGATATLHGTAPGRATLVAEYVAAGGRTVEEQQEASCVRLTSINAGKALPKLGLHDAKGNRISAPKAVLVAMEPAGATDLLRFRVADPGIATATDAADHLLLQGLREGTTTLQPETKCGDPVGAPMGIEVVPCDDGVIAELQSEQRMLRARIDSNVRQQHELVTNRDFNRAADDIGPSTAALAKSAAQLVIGASGNPAAKKFGDFIDHVDVAADAISGDWDQAALGAVVIKLDDERLSAVKTVYDAVQAAERFGRNLGELWGAAQQLDMLESQLKETERELNDVYRRLNDVCRVRARMTAAAAGGPSHEPDAETWPGAYGDPPLTSSRTAAAARLRAALDGMPASCGCGQTTTLRIGWAGNATIEVATSLQALATDCVLPFTVGRLTPLQIGITMWEMAFEQVKAANALPGPARREQLRALLPAFQELVATARAAAGDADAFATWLSGCPDALEATARDMTIDVRGRSGPGSQAP